MFSRGMRQVSGLVVDVGMATGSGQLDSFAFQSSGSRRGAPLCSLPRKRGESVLQFVMQTEPREGFLTGNAKAPLISSSQNCCPLCRAEIKQKAINTEKVTYQ